MVKLTVITAAEKARRKAEKARQDLQSSGFTAPTTTTSTQSKKPQAGDFVVEGDAERERQRQEDLYNEQLRKIEQERQRRERERKAKQEKKDAERLAEIKQKEIQANRKKLLNSEYFGDGLTKDEMDKINAMNPNELSNAVDELDAKIKAREDADKQRRKIRDAKETDGQTLTKEELDEIANMSTEELKTEIARLEKEIEQDEFDASRRRDVDDTDAPDAAVDTDEEDDAPVNKDKPSVSKAQLQHAIEECHRAYFPDDVPEDERKYYRVIEHEGAQALVKKHIVAIPNLGINAGTWEVSFRGTQFPDVKTGIYNAIADLNSHLISLDHAFVPLQLYSPNPISLDPEGVTTVGFAKHLQEIYEEIMDVLMAEPDYDIIVNGHSLGAICGQLFALRMFMTGGPIAKRVYAFASPRGFDTLGPFVSQNMEFIHVLDERDPVTYMYSIFYESHAGFKIIRREQNEQIEYLNDDEFVPWCIKDKDESVKVYRSRQVNAISTTTKSGLRGGETYTDFDNYWFKNVGVMNKFFQRSKGSFLAFVKQWQFSLNIQGAKQFLERIASTGDTYHYIPEYRKLIEQLDDEPHFFMSSHVDYKGLEQIETISSGKEDLHFTDYWQLKSNPTLPQQIPEQQQQQQQQQQQLSQNLADYVTGDMLVNGFIVYDQNAKNKHENNFILY